MKPYSSKDISAAKQARRARLASLPIDEKADLIEQLHELARTMNEARESMEKPAAAGESRQLRRGCRPADHGTGF